MLRFLLILVGPEDPKRTGRWVNLLKLVCSLNFHASMEMTHFGLFECALGD